MLGGFDFGLQVSRRVKVLALLPRAAALYVVHTHSDCIVVGVNHSAICWVGKATVVLATCAVTPLVFPTHLGHICDKKEADQKQKYTLWMYSSVHTDIRL